MTPRIRRALALVVAVGSALGLSACSGATNGGGASSEKTYIIASDNSFAPFEFLDTQTNTYIGVDMDILDAIATNQGFKYEVRNVGFEAAMGQVQTGQADGMIAGMTINDARKATFDFSDGYFDDGQILAVPADSSIASLDDLQGKVVAVKTSTQGATYAQSIAGQYGFTVQFYEDSPTMYTAVINGSNAACFEDRSVVGWAIQDSGLALKTVGDVINPGSYGFAVKKGTNADLLDKFNKGLAAIKADGTYATILAKYGY
ncbi:MAG: transporter substrate-binding domain-containing protein [Propionibacteriaceae bacterium]|nr:transporter substrate-binding domain-containing protein [Propionibacteriaceae bacterium]